MSEEEKEAINNLRLYSTNVGFSKYDGATCVLRAKDVQIVLNLIGKQYAELNNLKEIEKSHKEENGKLRVELEQEKSKTPETIRKQFEVYQNKIQALEKQHDYDMQMIDEVKGNAVKLANERDGIYNDYQDLGKENLKLQEELEQEKEKNKELEYQNKILQEKNQDYKCNYDTMAKQKEALEKHQKQYLDGELITAKQGKFFEKMIKENYISKDKIRKFIKEELPEEEICNTCEIYDVNGISIKEKLEKILEEK